MLSNPATQLSAVWQEVDYMLREGKAKVEKTIKPIETKHNGFRFRSRLEARWAVFFDMIDLKYEYEVEGFEMKGIRYLPDFYIPSLDR